MSDEKQKRVEKQQRSEYILLFDEGGLTLMDLSIELRRYENVIQHWDEGWRANVPYINSSQHCLALSGEPQTPEAVAASRCRCRSFLAAQADEKPSDDLLGH